jgi:hypothetical protein
VGFGSEAFALDTRAAGSPVRVAGLLAGAFDVGAVATAFVAWVMALVAVATGFAPDSRKAGMVLAKFPAVRQGNACFFRGFLFLTTHPPSPQTHFPPARACPAGEQRMRRAFPTNNPMSKIATKLRGLSPGEKLLRGRNIVAEQTGNPNVPGNEAMLAAFEQAQQTLAEAVAAAVSARNAAKAATAAQAAAELAWDRQAALLASFTNAVTGGEPAKILGTGFGVCAAPSPTPALTVMPAVSVYLNGIPGHSRVTWDPIRGALGYLVQGSADPNDETSWTDPVVTRCRQLEANGAVPGQPYWYRVAAFNAAGQGPWSMAVQRPVM